MTDDNKLPGSEMDALEKQLAAVPVPKSRLSMEDMLYQAGWHAAMQQVQTERKKPLQTFVGGFAGGAIAAAAAALLLLSMTATVPSDDLRATRKQASHLAERREPSGATTNDSLTEAAATNPLPDKVLATEPMLAETSAESSSREPIPSAAENERVAQSFVDAWQNLFSVDPRLLAFESGQIPDRGVMQVGDGWSTRPMAVAMPYSSRVPSPNGTSQNDADIDASDRQFNAPLKVPILRPFGRSEAYRS